MSVELAAIGAGVEIANRAVDIGGKVVNIVEDGLDRNQERGIRKNKADVALVGDIIQQADTALSVILKAANVADQINRIIHLHGPYGFIHKQTLIRYNGKNAKLVQDYIFWNELTVEVFVPSDVSVKYSIASKLSDKETEKLYNQILLTCTFENIPDAAEILINAKRAVESVIIELDPALMEKIENYLGTYHGSKVKQGAFAECRIAKYADKACILDEANNRCILLTSENVQSCRFVEEKFKLSRMKTYYYYEIDYTDGSDTYNSYIRVSEKYRKCLEKYVAITTD